MDFSKSREIKLLYKRLNMAARKQLHWYQNNTDSLDQGVRNAVGEK